MTVPYAFGAATSAIPLSQLDANFNTPITLGNTAIQLGNTVTTLNNMTLANVTISSGNVTITNVTVTTANATTVNTTTLIATTANVTTGNVTNLISGNVTLTGGSITGTPISGSTGSFTTLTTSGTVTLNGGVANGVAYLDGSKVLTTGSALTFDGTNLGVGVASPGYTVQVKSSDASVAVNSSDDTSILRLNAQSGLAILETVTNTDLRFRINSSEQMRLTSTGLGIGTSSPGAKLDVNGGGSTTAFRAYSSTANIGGIITSFNNTSANFYDADTHTFRFGNGGGPSVVINSSGNLGLGVTPSAWTGYTAFQVKSASLVSSGAEAVTSQNAYYNAGWKYYATNFATQYSQDSGSHKWYTAASGTAGNAISFTQAMTLNASGSLGIGTTSPVTKIHTVGGNGSSLTLDNAGEVYSGLDISNNGTRKAFVQNHNTNNLLYIGSDTGGLAFYANAAERARIDSTGNVVAGGSVALATNATDGFLYVPTCAGTPTGTPTAITGMAPIVVNTTNNKLYFYSGGAWRDAGP